MRLAALLLALALPAQAYFMDGNALLERMEDPGTVKPMVALGFVMGVADAYDGVEICIPETVQARQPHDVVKKWLRDNPERRHLPAGIIVYVVLKNVWPCKADLQKGSRM